MSNYFDLRNIEPERYADYDLPKWLTAELETVPPESAILDFGCGFGQLLSALKKRGMNYAEGADIEPAAIAYCRAQTLDVHDLKSEPTFFEDNRDRYALIVTSHVLEHIPKKDVIALVERLRGMLTISGRLIVAVPNAQAFTGSYWAYEDFTHETLYTSGSIYHVLRAAGFNEIRLIDIDCTAGLGGLPSVVRRFSRWIYDAYYRTMSWLLASPTHSPSPNVYSYELKVVARRPAVA